ncbi:MAG TPA: phytanoyl-CoA dioxygenase family protein [Fimbriimonadaceae bacterium]|nr:phytanoyl-CoA dioxygenase family protein [Fimbriimonadaceae bacterium]
MPTGINEKYDRDGYAIVRGVIDKDLVEEAREHIKWLLKQNPDLPPEGLDTGLVADDPFWLRLVSDPRLLDVVEEIVGPNIALFASHYIAKPPKTGKAVGWHQDGSYWPLDPMDAATVWLSLDKVDAENGCMYVLPGTQGERIRGLEEMHAKKDTVLGNEMDMSMFDLSTSTDIELEPGDISLHQPTIVHGSNANTSDRWRRGLTIRYIPTTTRVTNWEHPGPWLLRGEPGTVNKYSPFPKYDPTRHFQYKVPVTSDDVTRQT